MQNVLLFLVMSLIWGLTWIAAKAGVNAVPPIFFVAIRYLLVGAAMLAWVSGVSGLFAPSKVARIVVTGALVNVGTYSLLFWAIQSVPSGVAGLINLALTPVALFGFAILVGDEESSWRHAISLILGLTGLGLLFLDKVGTGTTDVWGVVAIVLGTFSYALGSVLAFAPASRNRLSGPSDRSASGRGWSRSHGAVGVARAAFARELDGAPGPWPTCWSPVPGNRGHVRCLHNLSAAGEGLGSTTRGPLCFCVARDCAAVGLGGIRSAGCLLQLLPRA